MKSQKEYILEYIYESNNARKSVDIDKIIKISNQITKSLKNGGKFIIFGNGGSAAEAQHIAAEFIGRFEKERKAIPAMALNVNTSSLTAIANDYSYEDVFARQLEAFGKKGDFVMGLSTSGNSKNVIKALIYGKENGMNISGITGEGGGKMRDIVPEDMLIMINSKRTSYIQEASLMIGHIISKLVEDEFFYE